MVSNVDFNVNLDTVLSIYATPSINLVINPNDNELHSDTLSVDVSTNNPTGYTLTMSTANTNLVNSTVSSATIPTLTSSTTATNFPTNYWGISTDSGNNFIPMPTEFSFTPTTGPDNHSITNLILGTKANTEKPAGTYTGVITFSATTNQVPVTWSTMTTMQEMTPEICASQTTPAVGATVVPTKQLEDARDGKNYWVAKLADGNCWMTQNLDFDLTQGVALTADTSDVGAEGWTPSYSTYRSISDWKWRYVIPESYDPDSSEQDLYVVASNSTSNDNKYSSLPACTTAGNTEEVCVRGNVGNYYNWHAATAGADVDAMYWGQEAEHSICPASWRLPSTVQTSKSWDYMLRQSIENYDGDSIASQTIRTAPFFLVRAGHLSGRIVDVGSASYYMASSAGDDDSSQPLFINDQFVFLSLDMSFNGQSIRCVAR